MRTLALGCLLVFLIFDFVEIVDGATVTATRHTILTNGCAQTTAISKIIYRIHNYDRYLPCNTIPCSMHFLKRQYWHLLRCAFVISHVPSATHVYIRRFCTVRLKNPLHLQFREFSECIFCCRSNICSVHNGIGDLPFACDDSIMQPSRLVLTYHAHEWLFFIFWRWFMLILYEWRGKRRLGTYIK